MLSYLITVSRDGGKTWTEYGRRRQYIAALVAATKLREKELGAVTHIELLPSKPLGIDKLARLS